MLARPTFFLRLASAALSLAAVLGNASPARAATGPPPLTGPYFNFSASMGNGTESVTLTLTGFTNDPAGRTPGSPEFANHSIWAFYEKTFEQQGGVVLSGRDVTGDNAPWTFHADVGFSTPTMPVVPQDPRTFLLTTAQSNNTASLSPSDVHLYNQIFYFYNYDNETGLLFLDEAPPPLGGVINGQLVDPTKNRGPIAFGVPCPNGQVCGGTIRNPAGSSPAAVPEPGSLTALSLGAGAIALSLKRRRRA